MNTVTRRLAGAAAAGALVFGAFAPTSSAQAAEPEDKASLTEPSTVDPFSCSHSWSDRDGTVGNSTVDGARIRRGPHVGCWADGAAQRWHRLDYDCFVATGEDETWTHVRDLETGVSGWVRDDLLSGYGSWEPC